MSITIARIAPDLLNTFGDLESSRVLAMRAAWAGIPVQVVDVSTARDWKSFDAIIIGSGPVGMLERARDVLMAGRDRIADAIADGAPVLAISAGFELLGESVQVSADTTLRGLGLVPIRTTLGPRVTGRIVVDAGEHTVTGFENHDRRVEGATTPFGAVVEGEGNGDGFDGVRHGSLIGLHAHGPVLSLNPWLADEMLTTLAKRGGATYATGAEHERVDAFAAAARANVR